MEKELHTNESNNIDIHSTSLERKLSLALHSIYNHRTTKTNQKYPSVNL